MIDLHKPIYLTGRQIAYIIGIPLVVIILYFELSWDANWKAAHPAAPESPSSSFNIYDGSTEILKRFLKAPSTAKFSEPFGNEAGASCLSNDVWRVWGYVDSQNSFGAMIRSDWTMIVEVTGKHIQCKEMYVAGERIN